MKLGDQISLGILTLILCSMGSACGSQSQQQNQIISKKSDIDQNHHTVAEKTDQQSNRLTHLNVKIYVDLKIQQDLAHQYHLDQYPLDTRSTSKLILTPAKKMNSVSDSSDFQESTHSVLYTLSSPLYKLIDQVNLIMHSRGIHLELVEILPWSSEQNSIQHSLATLAHELRNKATLSQGKYNNIYLGLTSTSLPSFTQLNDLTWSDLGSPVIVIRDPRVYYQGAEEPTLQAMSRLIVYSLLKSLGSGQTCNQGWSQTNRDEILGLISLKPIPSQKMNQSTPPQSRHPLIQGADLTPDHIKTEGLWYFKPIKWDELSIRILQQAKLKLSQQKNPWHWSSTESCQLFQLIDTQCFEDHTLLKSFAHQCFLDEDQLISLYQNHHLQGDIWHDERESARGLLALRTRQYEIAFKTCVDVANRKPSLVASKCAGIAAYQIKQYQKAILYLRAYLSSHPYDIQTSSTLARILGEQGSHSDAVSLLRLLLEHHKDLGSERGRIYLNLGIGEARLGRWDQAKWAWNKVQADEVEFKHAQQLLEQFSQKTSSN